jgi:two-component system chemotaxis response regulator CheY
MAVLSIGQCRPDQAGIAFYLQNSFGASTQAAATEVEAFQLLEQGKYELILVNRVLDLDGSDGLALIERILASDHGDTPVMLVSNYPDWQEKAISSGAVPGFGKAELNSAETKQRLQRILHG